MHALDIHRHDGSGLEHHPVGFVALAGRAHLLRHAGRDFREHALGMGQDFIENGWPFGLFQDELEHGCSNESSGGTALETGCNGMAHERAISH